MNKTISIIGIPSALPHPGGLPTIILLTKWLLWYPNQMVTIAHEDTPPPGGAINYGTANQTVTMVPKDPLLSRGAANQSITDQPVTMASEDPPPSGGASNCGTTD